MSRLIFLLLIMLCESLERVTMGRLAHGSIEVDQIICTPFCLGVGKLDAVTRFVHFFEILNSLRREHNDALRWARSLSFTVDEWPKAKITYFTRDCGIRPTIKSDDILMLLGFFDIENFVVPGHVTDQHGLHHDLIAQSQRVVGCFLDKSRLF